MQDFAQSVPTVNSTLNSNFNPEPIVTSEPIAVTPKTSSLTIVKNKLRTLKEKLAHLFSQIHMPTVSSAGAASTSRARIGFNKKKFGKLVLAVVIIGVVYAGWRMQTQTAAQTNTNSLGETTMATLTTPIEREYLFAVYDKNKKLADPIKYVISDAQLTKQIIIKGQKATAVAGRSFLIINLKLINEFDQSLFLNTRNYIRVQPAGETDKLAPEIHNDTVEVQPLSTKLTRIGLPVDEGIKEFVLYIGELDGEKQEIPITFQ